MLSYGPPIYQAYLDAVNGQIKQQEAKMDLGLRAVELQQGVMNIQNQIAERKAIAQAYQQAAQPTQQQGGQGQQAGGQQGGGQQQGGKAPDPGTNPATGQPNVSPAEKTAKIYDSIAQSLGPVNPKLALEYSTKASTLRDQDMTRQKTQLEVGNAQATQVGKIFGSIMPGDQEGYTAALQQASGMGIDISKFGLSGNVVTDMPKLKQIAQDTLTYKDKIGEQHQKVTEDQAALNYQEKVRFDSGKLGLENAQVGLASQRVALDKQFKEDELSRQARVDARAQAGVNRTDSMDLAKSKDFAGRPGKQDTAYVQSVIEADPTLSKLPDNQKKAALQQLTMGARAQLAKSVKKPGDTVTSDDFTRAVNKLVPMVKKQVDPGTSGILGIGGKDPSLKALLPDAIDTKAQFDQLPVGGQFRKGDGMYKKTGPNDYAEIK